MTGVMTHRPKTPAASSNLTRLAWLVSIVAPVVLIGLLCLVKAASATAAANPAPEPPTAPMIETKTKGRTASNGKSASSNAKKPERGRSRPLPARRMPAAHRAGQGRLLATHNRCASWSATRRRPDPGLRRLRAAQRPRLPRPRHRQAAPREKRRRPHQREPRQRPDGEGPQRQRLPPDPGHPLHPELLPALLHQAAARRSGRSTGRRSGSSRTPPPASSSSGPPQAAAGIVARSHSAASGSMRRVDLVADGRLVVVDREAAGLDQLAGAAGETDLHDRVALAVGDEGPGPGRSSKLRLPALDRRDEAAEGEDARRPPADRRRAPSRSSSPCPSRSRRAPSPRARSRSAPRARRGARRAPRGRRERCRGRGSRPAAPGTSGSRRARQRQRRPRRDDVQPPLGVEHVGEAEQVALVGAAAVMEDEQPLRLAAAGRSEVASASSAIAWLRREARRRSCSGSRGRSRRCRRRGRARRRRPRGRCGGP